MLRDASFLTVGVNGGTIFVPLPASCGRVLSIVVNMGSGDDTVTRDVASALTNVGDVPVDGGAGNDVLHAVGRPGSLAGGTGNDVFVLTAPGTVPIAGGVGTDTVKATGFDFTLTNTQLTGRSNASLSSVEAAELSGNNRSADTIDARGFSGATRLRGLDNDDVLRGGSGPDTLIGGPGKDTLDGGGGADTAGRRGR